MYVIIVSDLEGASCVGRDDMIPFENEGYQEARKFLMADVNAAIEGAFSGGATKVTVLDGHGGGGNFIPGALDERANLIPGSEFVEKPLLGYDALFCVGAHAMAGTEKAFLDHTQCATKWFEYCINGVPCGEMAQQVYCLGAFGVPLVMMSGDRATCEEAKRLAPGVVTACVKATEYRNRAECLPQEEALDLIRAAAKEGVQRTKEIRPCVLPLPAEIRVTFTRNDYCDEAMHEGLERQGRTVQRTLTKIGCYADIAFP